ncbi:MAG: ROK family transcriptional regulator [Treponema sp.]|jgi:predicted NBD/HSP70 family sugar kinase|nr:ROK family transcriptional regulator [Treponema sp.]
MKYDSISAEKQTNRNRVYQLVYQQGSISKPEIATRLGISLPTVIQNVKNLQQEGLLKEGGVMESTGGRKAVSITYEKNARFAIGTDITRNHISIVLINLAGEIIESIKIEKLYENTPAYYLEMVQLIKQLIVVSGIREDVILGAGFSIPGILARNGQMLIYSHVLQVSALQCSTIGRGLPYPTELSNDANAAGIAETWQCKSQENAAYLSLSDYVGGAIFLNNELYLGENQRGGEFGHMTLVRDGLPCYCGRKGCVDAYCSAQVLSRHTGGNLGAFFEGLRTGDKSLQIVWDQYLSYLTTAINNLVVPFDCKVILGGYLGEYLEPYIDEIRRSVAEVTTFWGNEDYITACTYKREASAVGAALLFVRPFIKQL